jgi:rRNA small subunit pseudouridine methyltransferase Nep1
VLSLILAEAELELIPKSMFSHPSVIGSAKQKKKNPSQIILDASLHHSAMKKLKEGGRRGRPDITHIFLLCVLESIANKENMIQTIIVHTRNNEMIFIDPETRIMRNYPRFIGLMEQLFYKKRISTGEKTLLTLTPNKSLKEIVDHLNSDRVVVFSDQGQKVELQKYFTSIKEKNHLLCIIGGFPSGTFHSDINSFADDILCIYPEKLTAWATGNELLTSFRQIFKE